MKIFRNQRSTTAVRHVRPGESAASGVSDEEALGQVGRQLRPHGLDAVHDLLLVADERDAERGEVGHGEPGHVLQPDDARLLEVVQVPGHLDRAQPLVHRPELQHVRRVRAQRVDGPAQNRMRVSIVIRTCMLVYGIMYGIYGIF